MFDLVKLNWELCVIPAEPSYGKDRSSFVYSILWELWKYNEFSWIKLCFSMSVHLPSVNFVYSQKGSYLEQWLCVVCVCSVTSIEFSAFSLVESCRTKLELMLSTSFYLNCGTAKNLFWSSLCLLILVNEHWVKILYSHRGFFQNNDCLSCLS